MERLPTVVATDGISLIVADMTVSGNKNTNSIRRWRMSDDSYHTVCIQGKDLLVRLLAAGILNWIRIASSLELIY